MSEAPVIDNAIPDGWYEDPARPDMQRWWSGNAWTEHVRYAEKKRTRSTALSPVTLAGVDERFADDRPFTVAIPAVAKRPFYEEPPVVSELPAIVAAPALNIVARPPFEITTAPTATPPVDNFYVPMARVYAHPAASATTLPQPRRGRAIALWVVGVVVLGAATGVALWVFLPH